MKIAIIIPWFPPKWLAGTELATCNIARHLAKRGHDIHVITSLDKGLPEESIEEGFHIHRISSPEVRLLGFILFRLKIFFLLKRLNPDIVHAQGSGLGISGLLARKILKKPYVIWWRAGGIQTRWLHDKVRYRLMLKNADAVIALTEDMKREIRKVCNRNVFVIPNAIELSEFAGLSREKARRELQIDIDDRIMLFVGGLRSVKGVEFLIQAMSIVGRHYSKVKLLIVGDGKERQSLESLTRKLDLERLVNFIGGTSHKNILGYMAASDVFVLPSLSEGFPNVLLEAMAVGLPIVATNVRGIPEIIKDGENGFLVDPKDAEGIAEKVLQFLANDDLRQRISRNNKERVKGYSWESAIEKLEEVYFSLSVNSQESLRRE